MNSGGKKRQFSGEFSVMNVEKCKEGHNINLVEQ